MHQSDHIKRRLLQFIIKNLVINWGEGGAQSQRQLAYIIRQQQQLKQQQQGLTEIQS